MHEVDDDVGKSMNTSRSVLAAVWKAFDWLQHMCVPEDVPVQRHQNGEDAAATRKQPSDAAQGLREATMRTNADMKMQGSMYDEARRY